MIVSVIDRLNFVREREELNKSQFERKLSKSSGYFNMLEKRMGNPGVDVLQTFVSVFPDYNLNWLLTGEGEMLKSQKGQKVETFSTAEEPQPIYSDVKAMHQDLKQELHTLAAGMVKNLEVISEGMIRGLQGQQKILDFVEKLNAEDIKKATEDLKKHLKI